MNMFAKPNKYSSAHFWIHKNAPKIVAHPEITKKAEVNVDPVLAEISETVENMEGKS